MLNRRSPNIGAVKVLHLLASSPHRSRLLVAQITLCIFANQQMHVSKVLLSQVLHGVRLQL